MTPATRSSAASTRPTDARDDHLRSERLAAAASDQLLAATDVADLLVKRGMPFREAHGVVAALVRTAVQRGAKLSELTPTS